MPVPGNFNPDPSLDGGNAYTTSSSKSGIFAANNDTQKAVGVGGNGVFGLSTVPDASGVFGANNGGGTGVSGNSDKGDGMRATTASSANSGIFAANNDTRKAVGVGGNGVFGLSTVPDASGVFGANNGGGTGVSGTSAAGTGVSGATQSVSHTRFLGSIMPPDPFRMALTALPVAECGVIPRLRREAGSWAPSSLGSH